MSFLQNRFRSVEPSHSGGGIGAAGRTRPPQEDTLGAGGLGNLAPEGVVTLAADTGGSGIRTHE